MLVCNIQKPTFLCHPTSLLKYSMHSFPRLFLASLLKTCKFRGHNKLFRKIANICRSSNGQKGWTYVRIVILL